MERSIKTIKAIGTIAIYSYTGEDMSADKLIALKEKVYEVYTCSGKRITVKGCNILTFANVGDLVIYDMQGAAVAQFQLANIEGWRVVE